MSQEGHAYLHHVWTLPPCVMAVSVRGQAPQLSPTMGLVPDHTLPQVANASPLLAGKPELPRQPGSTAQYDAEVVSPEAEPTDSDSPQSSSADVKHFLHMLDWQGMVGCGPPSTLAWV